MLHKGDKMLCSKCKDDLDVPRGDGAGSVVVGGGGDVGSVVVGEMLHIMATSS